MNSKELVDSLLRFPFADLCMLETPSNKVICKWAAEMIWDAFDKNPDNRHTLRALAELKREQV